MKLNAREIVLVWLTCVVMIGAATFYFVDPVLQQTALSRQSILDVERDIADEQRLVALGPRWQQRLDRILADLPRHDPGFDVTATLLREIEAQAARHDFSLAERRAEREEVQAEYSELDIACRGSAPLAGAVAFLYHLRSPSALLEVRQLRIEKDKFDYRVRVTINCVYGRNESAESQNTADDGGESSPRSAG